MKYLYLFFSIVIITAISWFSLRYWQGQYPIFMEFYDIAYHGAGAVGFQRCGGFALHNFWAVHSITGNPNVYFPLYQIIGFLILSAGAGAHFLTYWFGWMFLPLSFLSVLLFVYNTYGSKEALYSVILLGLSPVWMEKMWGAPPQALVYILAPLIFLSLVKKRYVIAFLLTICTMAAHFTGLFFLLFLFLYGLHNKKQRKYIFILLGALLLAGFPLILFGIQRVKAINLFIGFSNGTFLESIKWSFYRIFDIKGQMHVFLGWLAAVGLVISYLKRKQFMILPGYFLAVFPMAWTTQEVKFWGVPGLFIFSLLGGVALGSIHEYFINRVKEKVFLFGKITKSAVYSLLFFILIFLASSWFFYHASGLPERVKTPILFFLNKPDIWLVPELTFSAADRERVIKLVKENVSEDEIFWIESSNNINNQVALNSRRSAALSNTLQENGFTLVKGIKLVVSKDIPSNDYVVIDNIGNGFNAYVLKDSSPAAKIKIPKPLITANYLKIIFAVIGALILIDFFNLPGLVFRKIKS